MMNFCNQMTGLVVLLLLTGTVGCATVVPEEQLNAVCEAEAGLHSEGQVRVDGFYFPGPVPLNSIDLISATLGSLRFHYLEMDTDYVMQTGMRWAFKKKNTIDRPSARYIRFSVAKRGDPRCAFYEKNMAERKGRTRKVIEFRIDGLYPGACIAMEQTNELLSEYGLYTHTEPDHRFPDSGWKVNEVRHLATGREQATYRIFQHCRKGLSRSGRCRGYKNDIFLCPPPEQTINENWKSLLERNLLPTDNPLLAKKLETVAINEPITIPIQEVQPELLEVVEGEKKITRVYGDSFLDLHRPKDPEGRAWISNRFVRYTLDGVKYRAEKPLLKVIQDHERQLLKVDINIGQLYKRWGYFFSCMRAIPGEAIYFLAWGGAAGESRASGEFLYPPLLLAGQTGAGHQRDSAL